MCCFLFNKQQVLSIALFYVPSRIRESLETQFKKQSLIWSNKDNILFLHKCYAGFHPTGPAVA